ncbi:MAG: hypothetical protein V4438_01465 [Patescibacteria group bacterium]
MDPNRIPYPLNGKEIKEMERLGFTIKHVEDGPFDDKIAYGYFSAILPLSWRWEKSTAFHLYGSETVYLLDSRGNKRGVYTDMQGGCGMEGRPNFEFYFTRFKVDARIPEHHVVACYIIDHQVGNIAPMPRVWKKGGTDHQGWHDHCAGFLKEAQSFGEAHLDEIYPGWRDPDKYWEK